MSAARTWGAWPSSHATWLYQRSREMLRGVILPGIALGDLFDVRKVRRVVLRDVWSGMNPHSPIAAVYELHREASGALTGEGRFSTGLVAPKTVDVSMKAATASAFLDALAGARMNPGDYQPFMDHTDDFPSVEIALHGGDVAGGLVRLYTESQGRFHTPWGASIAGASYTIEGDEIGRALRALDRTLKRRELRLRLALQPGQAADRRRTRSR